MKKIYWSVGEMLRRKEGNVRRDVMFLRADGNLASWENAYYARYDDASIGRKNCAS